jgi:hypothetical protein
MAIDEIIDRLYARARSKHGASSLPDVRVPRPVPCLANVEQPGVIKRTLGLDDPLQRLHYQFDYSSVQRDYQTIGALEQIKADGLIDETQVTVAAHFAAHSHKVETDLETATLLTDALTAVRRREDLERVCKIVEETLEDPVNQAEVKAEVNRIYKKNGHHSGT